MIGAALLALVLVALALADCAFAGFRSHLGRDARLPDRSRSIRAAGRGIAIGSVGILLGALVAVIELLPAVTRDDRLEAMISGGLRALAFAAPPMVLALLGVALYVLPVSVSAKTLAMTLVLGPFTLLRPLVILLVVVAGASANVPVNLPVVALVGLTCLLVEPLLAIPYRAGTLPAP